jgi:hypothetical protein
MPQSGNERAEVTIRIMGRPYTVRHSNAPVTHDSMMGRSGSITAEMWIRADMDSFGKRQTLLHEIIHAIGEDCALDLSETQVSVLANGLASIEEFHLDLLEGSRGQGDTR